MKDDYYVTPSSKIDLESKAYAWREALGIEAHCAVPDLSEALEIKLPRLIPHFSVAVKTIAELKDAEAYTQHEPPAIVFRADVYESLTQLNRRARMTAAHELGHLVLHKSAAPMHRAPSNYKTMDGLKPFASAEYQANVFGAAFLIPEWIAVGFNSAVELAGHCQTSLQLASIRLESVQVKMPNRMLPDLVTRAINNLR